MTLDGAVDDKDAKLFKLDDGGATGLALRINGPDGEHLLPGAASAEILLNEGDNVGLFAAAYRSTDKVTAGDANATIQFSVSYN